MKLEFGKSQIQNQSLKTESQWGFSQNFLGS
jgi:hypothetical protein